MPYADNLEELTRLSEEMAKRRAVKIYYLQPIFDSLAAFGFGALEPITIDRLEVLYPRR